MECVIALRIAVFALTILTLASCRPVIDDFKPGLDHPANPAATSAKLPELSTLLSVDQESENAPDRVTIAVRKEPKHNHATAHTHGGGNAGQ